MDSASGADVIQSLIAAVNRHDLDALVAHFSPDVRSETPAHPARSFTGRDQIRRNWGQILGAIGDLQATVISAAATSRADASGTTVHAEIAFDGHRPDGAPWRMRGATVNEVVDGQITALRFYLEPVDEASVGVEEVVRESTRAGGGADRLAVR